MTGVKDVLFAQSAGIFVSAGTVADPEADFHWPSLTVDSCGAYVGRTLASGQDLTDTSRP